MKKRCIAILMIILMGALSVQAQAVFSSDKNVFVNELKAYFSTSTSKADREEAAEMMQRFEEVWNSYYSDSENNTVIGLCNLFRSKSGGNAYANIFYLIETLQKAPASGLTHKDVGNWLSFTDTKAHKSMNGMDKYLASSRSVFVDRVLSARETRSGFCAMPVWSSLRGRLSC